MTRAAIKPSGLEHFSLMAPGAQPDGDPGNRGRAVGPLADRQYRPYWSCWCGDGAFHRVGTLSRSGRGGLPRASGLRFSIAQHR